MTDTLRHLALTVTEPRVGLFHWWLLESTAGAGSADSADKSGVFARCVSAADEPYDSFDKAARAGLLQWKRLAEGDLRRGPRSTSPSQPLQPAPGPWSRSQDAPTGAQTNLN